MLVCIEMITPTQDREAVHLEVHWYHQCGSRPKAEFIRKLNRRYVLHPIVVAFFWFFVIFMVEDSFYVVLVEPGCTS